MKAANKLILLVLMVSGNAYSSNYPDAHVTEVVMGPNYGNIVLVALDVPPNWAVGADTHCQTNHEYNIAFDGTTAQGKMYLSAVLAAHAAKKLVSIAGYDFSCQMYGGVEDLYHIVVK